MNPLYKEFISMVEEIEEVAEVVGSHDSAVLVPFSREHLIAVKRFLKSDLERRSRGGRNSAGKGGRKVEYDDEKHIKRREAMRKWRAKQRIKNEGGQ